MAQQNIWIKHPQGYPKITRASLTRFTTN